MAGLKMLSPNRSFFWCSVKQYSPVTRTWHICSLCHAFCPSPWEFHLQIGSKSKWRILKGVNISVCSTLALLSHSSSMPLTNFLSFTNYFLYCPYYDLFFIQVTCLRSISWIHFGFCFQISFRIIEALQRLKWEQSIVCTWFFFCSDWVCRPRILSLFSQLPWDLISIFKCSYVLVNAVHFFSAYCPEMLYLKWKHSLEYIV